MNKSMENKLQNYLEKWLNQPKKLGRSKNNTSYRCYDAVRVYAEYCDKLKVSFTQATFNKLILMTEDQIIDRTYFDLMKPELKKQVAFLRTLPVHKLDGENILVDYVHVLQIELSAIIENQIFLNKKQLKEYYMTFNRSDRRNLVKKWRKEQWSK